jgi:2-dehydropantoate 2-reductase
MEFIQDESREHGFVWSLSMRIAIFGIGAMGVLFGAKLTPHADVTLIGSWQEQLDALRFAPLRLIYPNGREESVQVKAVDYDAAPGGVDVALVLTKATGTAKAGECAARILSPGGVAITLQNGLGNLEIIAEHAGAARAVLGVTTQGGALDGPGVLRVGGTGTTYLAAREGMEALADLLNKADLSAELVPDVLTLAWGKLAVNAAINPLTALLDIRNGALLDSEHTRAIMAGAAHEVAAVAAAQGIILPFDAAARAEEVARLTGPNRSSMLQDVQRGALTEIETICGAVMRQGAVSSVPTPTSTVLYHLIKSLEQTIAPR